MIRVQAEEMHPMSAVRLRVDDELEGQRLTRAISFSIEGISVRRAKELVDRGRVFVNERRILTASARLHRGDSIEIFGSGEQTQSRLLPEHILWESSELLVLNKPANLSVYGTHGVTGDTLLPRLEKMLVRANHWSKDDRLTLVHRLDKDTTGALLVARNPGVAKVMENQFRHRTVEKRYVVLAAGSFTQKPFEQHSSVQVRRHAARAEQRPFTDTSSLSGRDSTPEKAVTIFHVLEIFSGCAMLEALPETGRTHQIRIHLSRMGTPVLGDIRYGPQRITNPLFREIPRQMLHARSLGFTEPRTGDWIKVQAPMPRDMEDVLRRLRALS